MIIAMLKLLNSYALVTNITFFNSANPARHWQMLTVSGQPDLAHITCTTRGCKCFETVAQNDSAWLAALGSWYRVEDAQDIRRRVSGHYMAHVINISMQLCQTNAAQLHQAAIHPLLQLSSIGPSSR